MSGTISELHVHLGYWLRIVSNQVSHAFASKLAAEGVTVAEWAMLRQLYGIEEMSPSRLAADMGLTRGAVSKLSDRLIRKEMIVRVERDDDARAHYLHLSKAGRELVPRLAVIADRNDQSYFSHLTHDERTTIEQILKTIVESHGLTSMPLT